MSSFSTPAVRRVPTPGQRQPQPRGPQRRADGRPGLSLTPVPSVRTDDEQPTGSGTELPQGRGLVLYVGLSEERARAAGTSLERIAYALRTQLSALLPEADSEVRLVTSAQADDLSDLAVVRGARRGTGVRPTWSAPAAGRPVAVPDGVEIDLDRQRVRVDGATAALSAQQFALLRLLITCPGVTLSRRELSAALGHGATRQSATPPASSRQVDVLVRRLRARLGTHGSAVVRTVRGVGYRFDPHPDVHIRPSSSAAHPLPRTVPVVDALTSAQLLRAELERHVNDVC